MDLLQQFANYLSSQKNKPSFLTIKNYKADVGQFIAWFEKTFISPFDPQKITMETLENYKNARNLSDSSIQRHVSSLRKFFSFLKEQGKISYNLLPVQEHEEKIVADPWMFRNFKSFLYENKKSYLTIKNYINDIKSFFIWLEEVALIKYSWNVADNNLLSKITLPVIEEYKQRLISANFSPNTINRKLSSLRSYIGWAKKQGIISEDNDKFNPQFTLIKNQVPDQKESLEESEKEDYSSFPPGRLAQKSLRGVNFLFDNLLVLPLSHMIEATKYLLWKSNGEKIFEKNLTLTSPRIAQPDEISNIRKEFYAPLSASSQYLPLYKRAWYYIRYVRPNWYKRYHSYAFIHYFHFAVLTMVSCVIGLTIYNRLFMTNPQVENTVLGTTTSASPRILSFQGRLTDSSQTPITKEANVLFSLYENADSLASAWQETDNVKPDANGFFSIYLGKNNPIPDTLFYQNSKLFLGITVGSSPELRPRQEIATAPFARDSQMLQGLKPITDSTVATNVVLALDSSGNLNIADAKDHTFQAIGGNLILAGKVLSLTTTPGSNSNIEIVPDGMGQIDLTKPIRNSTNNNNLSAALGSVEFDDSVAILATTSGQSAFYINQNSTGQLISANTNNIAKFTVDSGGTGSFAGPVRARC